VEYSIKVDLTEIFGDELNRSDIRIGCSNEQNRQHNEYSKVAQIPGARSPWRRNFVR